ncbi:putative E3 ubiquitin-protein ligase HIP1 isoform X1 [Iris pallida]|uniref:RING-type E3 ubiquitin transferase n=1 Tax=Iris pallida TaxID=29817 RepID=A0AAX6EJ19_IRIPA|nr:putative E3 ubiquitin-protein ligase HIP1 isoform X1 [Iris pallida]
MDQQILWDDFLNPADTQNLPASPVFPSDTNMPCANPAGEGSDDLRMWSSGGPSSSRHLLNPSTHEETKMELGWPSSLTIHGSQGSGTEEQHLEATNMFLGLRAEDCGVDTNKLFSLEAVNLNLNSNQADSDQLFSENLSADNFIKHSDQNAGRDGTSSRAPESAELLHPNSSRSLGSSHVSSGGSLNLRGSSSSGIGFLTENFEGRSGSSLDDQHMSRKRKNIEGVPAQSSADRPSSCLYQTENSLVHSVPTRHSSNTSLNISSSSNYRSGINPSAEQLNPRISTNARLGASDFLPFNIAANAESSQRNCRSRINPPQDSAAPPSSWLPGNSLLPSGPWSFHQPSLLIPFTQALDSRVAIAAGTSETQPLVLPSSSLVPNMQPLSLTGASSSRTDSSRSTAIARQRTGSSTISSTVAVQRTGSLTRAPAVAVQRTGSSRRAPTVIPQRSIGLREESSSRSTSRNNVSESTVFVPATDVRNSVQDPSSWGLANGSIGIGHVSPVSQAVTPAQVQQLAGQTWMHYQNAASHYQRVAEVVRRSSFSPGISEPGQGINLSQRSANSNTSEEINHQSSGAVRGHQRPYARSSLLMDRQSERVLGIPLRSLAAAREGRNRMLSEHIRNVMQLAHRGGENLHLEDILLFDHSVFYGGAADLRDRHRDLRLDVDNMSYEELLALEERIGNVSTGVSEETVMKYLKQRKYISLSEETPAEVEPCCVCQEEYMEGEDVGRLNCGHDFHTACIKQWLLLKNLCPICKKTGLDTEKHKKCIA